MEQDSKKKLWIFIACAYGVVVLMSIFMYIGLRKSYDLNLFITAQMMYPACGVILGKMITRKKDEKLPMGAFITTLVVTALMMIIALLSVFAHLEPVAIPGSEQTLDVYPNVMNIILMIGSIVAYALYWQCGKDVRKAHGLAHNNVKLSAVFIALFVVLYIGRLFIASMVYEFGEGPAVWIRDAIGAAGTSTGITGILLLPINYFLVFLPFFGEEYGWRYYLQPIMQKKFGNRLGVILLGIVWGLWHWDADFMFYTKESGLVMQVNQIITCIVIAIFFGYVMMKTNNIWACVIMHYLNNNLIPIFAGSADVISNQSAKWGQIPGALAAGLIFAVFIFAPIYSKKKEEIPLLAEA